MQENKKILMATMQMDIGGAETHILELSRALVRKGYTVCVASNGGAFVPELEKSGIRHYTIPLNSKSPLSVSKSMRMLKKLIAEENFDIVHAHARIPAFICGMLAKKMHFKFITSAHWVFVVTPLWKKLANWGQRSVAVSEDIKQYLIDSYGLSSDNISVTINGIDTESFAPGIDASKQFDEFKLNPEARRIVCVSRMDKSRGKVPLLLAENAERLCEKYPDLEIMLVGGSVLLGEENLLDRISDMAEKLNSKLGRRALILTGARTDIKELIATGDVFVGVSRAALEAMSESKPLILAGNEGYLGIFNESNTDIAIKTNFCCRGCELVSSEALVSDISKLLDMTDEQRKKLGEANRSLILQKYSADIMADDYISAYNALPCKTSGTDIIISGYYGFGNTGDESLLGAIISSLRREKPDVAITVLSANPKATEKQFNVHCISRTNYFAISRHMKRASLLISGGGSLLQNATSRKSLLYYLFILNMAKRRGLKTMLYSNGIGPVSGERDRERVRRAADSADCITLRESHSLDELVKMGVAHSRLSLSADPAISLDGSDKNRTEYLLSSLGLRGKRMFAVSLRNHVSINHDSFEKDCAAAINSFCKEHSLTPVIIPMQPKHDLKICREVASLCDGATVLPQLSANDLISVLRHCDFVLGMRLHLLIYALCAGKAPMGISYDPKIDAFLEYSQMSKPIPTAAVTRDSLAEYLSKGYAEKAELEAIARKSRTALREKTAQDAEKAIALLKQKSFHRI